MGPLFQQAIDFVVDNASLMPSDPRFRQLAALRGPSSRRPRSHPARYSVWNLFQVDPDTSTLVNAATALGIIGAGDPEIIANLNRYVDAQNTCSPVGQGPGPAVVAACMQALGQLGDPSSFPSLFSAMNIGYPEPMTARREEALLALKGDFKENILGVIRSRPSRRSARAADGAGQRQAVPTSRRRQVAEVGAGDRAALRLGRRRGQGGCCARSAFLAARALGERRWSQATALLIAHLDATIGEYDKGLADKRYLLEATAAAWAPRRPTRRRCG